MFQESALNDYGDHVHSRAFLIRNLEINNIPGRIIIDFDKPDQQVIPDIGARWLLQQPDNVCRAAVLDLCNAAEKGIAPRGIVCHRRVWSE
jgi:hypothetical protein